MMSQRTEPIHKTSMFLTMSECLRSGWQVASLTLLQSGLQSRFDPMVVQLIGLAVGGVIA